jgi:hypothetical protein
MKSHIVSVGIALSIFGLAVNGVLAQQAAVKRNFDEEIQAALQSAKTAAGSEFLGTLGPDVPLASERRRKHHR